jgi:hypothetical protein
MNDYFEVGSTDPCLIFGKTGYVRLKSSGLAESLLFVLFDLGGVYLLLAGVLRVRVSLVPLIEMSSASYIFSIT